MPTAKPTAKAIATQRNIRSIDGMVLAGVGVLAFSFTLPMTKIAVRGLDPVLATAGRAAGAGVLAMAVLASRDVRRPERRHLAGLVSVLCGVVLGFPLLTTLAVRHVPNAHGAIVIGLLPLATAGFAAWRGGERPSRRYWVCSVVGLLAVGWYAVRDGAGGLQPADALLVGAVLAAAFGYTEGAILSRELGGWQVICWALVCALPISASLAVALAVQDPPTATAGQWSAFAYTAIVSMFLGFFAWYSGLARAGIARGGQLQLAQPFLSVLWGWPLLGEKPNLRSAIAGMVVLLAVAVGRRAPVRSVRDTMQ